VCLLPSVGWQYRSTPPAGAADRPLAAMSATVAATLASTHLSVAVVSPRQLRDFARTTGTLA
jgi:hypothetical protein